jgi:RNA polymerase sigma-70 factor (ECF subfamily)
MTYDGVIDTPTGGSVDRALIERAQAGDRQAFADIARELGDRLYRLALRILRDTDAAAEAAQAAIVDVWRDLPTLRDVDRLDAWSYRILVNRCRGQRRLARRMPSTVGLLPGHAVIADSQATIGLRDELERGFARLNVDQRAVLALVYYRDLSIPEAAAALGVSVGTVKSRLHYARQVMRAAIEADARPAVQEGPSA